MLWQVCSASFWYKRKIAERKGKNTFLNKCRIAIGYILYVSIVVLSLFNFFAFILINCHSDASRKRHPRKPVNKKAVVFFSSFFHCTLSYARPKTVIFKSIIFCISCSNFTAVEDPTILASCHIDFTVSSTLVIRVNIRLFRNNHTYRNPLEIPQSLFVRVNLEPIKLILKSGPH